VWDSWLAVDGDEYHLFFLRASRALLDPHRRHLRAAVGHAVSTDLRSWTLVPDALVHADAPAWDEQAVWTGSVVRGPDGTWYMFYTGVQRSGWAALQRVGVALSADLVRWRRARPAPVVEADPRWYDCLDGEPGVSVAWRDPYVFPDPDGDGWHMVITARSATGPPRWGGILGHARSHNLVDWEVQPPLTEPAGFRELEVTQVHLIGGRAVLVFSCAPESVAASRATTGATTWTVVGDKVADGWDVATAVPFPHETLYGGRLVRGPDGGWYLLGFRDLDNGVFVGEILDPVPVDWVDGRLVAR
jgi:beta-fructofuranosidase